MIYLLTKSPRYYYDQEAVRVPLSAATLREIQDGYNGKERKGYEGTGAQKPSETKKRILKNLQAKGQTVHTMHVKRENGEDMNTFGPGANLKTVWDIPTQPYPKAHFATFPEKIPELCIKAGTSEKGACSKCGSPWVRILKKSRTFQSGSGRAGNLPKGKNGEHLQGGGETIDVRRGPVVDTVTLGWKPSCKCEGAQVVPCIILDPFAGSGTTLRVAKRMNRDFVGIELNGKYITDLIEPSLAEINPLGLK